MQNCGFLRLCRSSSTLEFLSWSSFIFVEDVDKLSGELSRSLLSKLVATFSGEKEAFPESEVGVSVRRSVGLWCSEL